MLEGLGCQLCSQFGKWLADLSTLHQSHYRRLVDKLSVLVDGLEDLLRFGLLLASGGHVEVDTNLFRLEVWVADVSLTLLPTGPHS